MKDMKKVIEKMDLEKAKAALRIIEKLLGEKIDVVELKIRILAAIDGVEIRK